MMSITNRIRLNNLRGDIFRGMTAAVVLLPLVIAFDVASGMGAIDGFMSGIGAIPIVKMIGNANIRRIGEIPFFNSLKLI